MAQEAVVVVPRKRCRLATTDKALPALFISNLLFVLAASGGSFNSIDTSREEPGDLLEELMKNESLFEAGHKQVGPSPVLVRDLVDTFGSSLIPHLLEYVPDESPRVRDTAYFMLADVAREFGSSEERRQVLDVLVDAELHDTGAGVDRWRLLAFSSEDFTENAKQLLSEELADYAFRETTHDMSSSVILMAGVADICSTLPALQQIEALQKQEADAASLPTKYRLLHWSALRARARLGDSAAIHECIQRVEAEPDVDNRTRMLDELAYVRQPEVVEYIHQYLLSDDETKVNDYDVMPLPHYERAVNALADMLVGFPEFASIEKQRAWMSQQAAWDIRR